MLISTEHGISTAKETKMLKNKDSFSGLSNSPADIRLLRLSHLRVVGSSPKVGLTFFPSVYRKLHCVHRFVPSFTHQIVI